MDLGQENIEIFMASNKNAFIALIAVYMVV